MKGKLKIIIITLVLLLIGTGALLWKINDVSKEITAREEAKLAEERDLLEEQKGKAIDETNPVNITPLYMSGDKKNVVTTEFSDVKEVYSVAKSAEVEETLTDIKKNKIFTPEDPLWAYNPYGTNRNSMYVYFETKGNCYCRYTISVKDEKIADFTRTAISNTSGNVTKEHEYQLIGLVAGETNYITMRLYNSSDELSEVRTFSVDIPESRVGASNLVTTVDGRSKTTISNGLYVVFQDAKKDGRYAILLYDNSGTLRGEIPTLSKAGRNLEQVYDTLLYASGDRQFSTVNALGQVMKTLPLNGYKLAGEFDYDDCGNIFLIVTELKKGAAPRSKLVKMELESGKTTEMVDMNDLLEKVYENAAKKAGKRSVDWVGLNSVEVVDATTLMLSAKKLSSVFKVSNIGSLVTKIDYIIADKELYKSYKGLRRKVLVKSAGDDAEPSPTPIVDNILHEPVVKDPFTSQYGQEAISYKAGSEGMCTVTMLSTNTGTGAKNTGKATYYSYLVDELAMTYELKAKRNLEKTTADGNVVMQESSFVYCCSDKKQYAESDMNGKLIKQFSATTRPYRVYKEDFKNFWFY